jgi:hypothetical protein
VLIGLIDSGDDDDEVDDEDVDDEDDDDGNDEDDDDDDASEVVSAMTWLRIQSPTEDKVTLRVTCSFGTFVIATMPIHRYCVY